MVKYNQVFIFLFSPETKNFEWIHLSTESMAAQFMTGGGGEPDDNEGNADDDDDDSEGKNFYTWMKIK